MQWTHGIEPIESGNEPMALSQLKGNEPMALSQLKVAMNPWH
jgi:hypothetical protein